ncbi:hypothetical protein B0J12DRAFT_332353 [Macrophomina phaseolina]|uniref:Uncharacterized protein n=1 Tax=Macrophomina phaseolina TaxID=35725 RepID=A0ABQ8GL88_9PEZI|nr:hypothetical protein B0J12DRAFT_332353 [Macrophomina phaseolina]
MRFAMQSAMGGCPPCGREMLCRATCSAYMAPFCPLHLTATPRLVRTAEGALPPLGPACVRGIRQAPVLTESCCFVVLFWWFRSAIGFHHLSAGTLASAPVSGVGTFGSSVMSDGEGTCRDLASRRAEARSASHQQAPGPVHRFGVGDFLDGHRTKAFPPAPWQARREIWPAHGPPSRGCRRRAAAAPVCCRQHCSQRSMPGPSYIQQIRHPRKRNAPITESCLRQPARRGLGPAS